MGRSKLVSLKLKFPLMMIFIEQIKKISKAKMEATNILGVSKGEAIPGQKIMGKRIMPMVKSTLSIFSILLQ